MSKLIDIRVWQEWRNFEKSEAAPDFFVELLGQALQITPPRMTELLAAAHKQDFKLVAYNAHTMASTFQSLGAMSLAEKLKEIENANRRQPPEIRLDLVKIAQDLYNDVMHEFQTEHDRLKKAA